MRTVLLLGGVIMYMNNSLNKEAKDFPKKNSIVRTKNEKDYSIKKRKLTRIVRTKKANINVVIYEGESKEGDSISFGFVMVPNKEKTEIEGIFVSNQINKNTFMINENFLISYYKEMGFGKYIKSEEKIMDKADGYLTENYNIKELIRFPNPKDFKFLRFSFGNYQTKAKFSKMYQQLKGKRYTQKSSYIRSDFVADYNGKYIIVEIENTFHNKNDFLWKLYKLYKSKKNVLFIFKKNNTIYHLELISIFQRMIGRKCNKFMFITLNELETGQGFKYVVDWII